MKRFRFLTRDANSARPVPRISYALITVAHETFVEIVTRLIFTRSPVRPLDSFGELKRIKSIVRSANESFADRVETRPKEVERSSPPLTAVHPRHSSRFPREPPRATSASINVALTFGASSSDDRGRSIRGRKRFLSDERLTCAGHGHDQLLVKRETATRGQTGAQIHSQHAVLLLVPLQVLRILRPCGGGRTDRAAWRRGEVKEQENEKEYEPLQFPRLVSPGLLVLRTCFS